ncbi:hypothetical protein [Mycoplasmopsis agalactiae]|uniref:hypothetical protein n=1 Tax=Mycoplasmopsis agalactiae TaxID=2110 RepID=UPI001F43A4DC|nr:hypothetical protein [Mycoplasmopsis agalactiae]
MQVDKQVDKDEKKARIDSINEILSQTQEIVLESNNDSSINDILSSDILTNEQGDSESDFSEESPLINTSEIDLTQFDEDEPKIKLFPNMIKVLMMLRNLLRSLVLSN